MDVLPAGTVTLLLTDVAGSTALWAREADQMRQAMSLHDVLIESAIANHAGHVVKHTGDGIMAAFSTAPSAIGAAIDAHRALEDASWPVGTGALHVRMAVHTADLEPVDGDYRGPDLNLLARIEAAGHAGHILASHATAALLASREDLTVTDLGVHRLRGLDAPQRLFHVADAVSTSPVPRPRTGRPEFEGPNELVGREKELERLADLVEEHRLVTVTGPGGIGKTALVRGLLTSLPRRQPTALIDLTALDPASLAEGVADELGFGSFEALAGHLTSAEWLVAFDNCEHVLDQAASIIRTLLDRSLDLTVIATSREPTELIGERVLRLDPLPTGEGRSPAAQMFAARAASRGVTVDPASVGVQRLVSALDGLPLAIELAAARSGTFSPSDILDRLRSGADILERRRDVGPERHRSLAATIEWSMSLLDQPLRLAVERLAIHQGPFGIEMASAAIGDVGMAPDLVLVELVERSLILSRRDSDGSFRMLETIRTEALRHLRARGEEATTRDRVRRAIAKDLVTIGRAPIMSDLSVPYPLRVGFGVVRDVVEAALDGDDARERVMDLVRGFWALEDHGRRAEGALLLESVIRRWPEPNEQSGMVYGILAALHRNSQRSERAGELGRIAIASGSPEGAALGHRTLGLMARRLEQWGTAAEHFREGIEAARAAGEGPLADEIEIHLALNMARSGDLDGAVGLLERRLDSAPADDPRLTLHRLFVSWFVASSDPARARRLASAALAEGRAVWSVATASYQLGILDLLDGAIASAADHLHRSIACFVEIGDRTDLHLALLGAAAALSRSGDDELASAAVAATRGMFEPDLDGSPAAMGSWIGLGDFEVDLFERAGLDVRGRRRGRVIDPKTLLEPLARIAGAMPAEPHPDSRPNRMTRSGDVWQITYLGATSSVKDSKGMRDLAVLLSRPGVEVSAMDLMGADVTESGMEVSDATARRRYEARARELAEDIREARDHHDAARLSKAQEELDALADHLSSAFGLGGRARIGGETAERARSAVTWRIRSAIGKIAEVDEPLADHLDGTVRTGRFCVYEPEGQIVWQVM